MAKTGITMKIFILIIIAINVKSLFLSSLKGDFAQ